MSIKSLIMKRIEECHKPPKGKNQTKGISTQKSSQGTIKKDPPLEMYTDIP